MPEKQQSGMIQIVPGKVLFWISVAAAVGSLFVYSLRWLSRVEAFSSELRYYSETRMTRTDGLVLRQSLEKEIKEWIEKHYPPPELLMRIGQAEANTQKLERRVQRLEEAR